MKFDVFQTAGRATIIGLIIAAIFSPSAYGQDDFGENPLSHVEKVVKRFAGGCGEDNEGSKPENCSFFRISVAWFYQGNELADRINQKTLDFTSSLFYPDHMAGSYEELAEMFLDYYAQYYAPNDPHRDPDVAVGAYYIDAEVNISFLGTNILNMVMSDYAHQGGQSQAYRRFSLFLDPKTGGEIPREAIFRNQEAFRKASETFFRRQYGEIPAWKNGIFRLPENIILQPDAVLLCYNPYEIDPNIQDLQTVAVPLSAVRGFLKNID